MDETQTESQIDRSEHQNTHAFDSDESFLIGMLLNHIRWKYKQSTEFIDLSKCVLVAHVHE